MTPDAAVDPSPRSQQFYAPRHDFQQCLAKCRAIQANRVDQRRPSGGRAEIELRLATAADHVHMRRRVIVHIDDEAQAIGSQDRGHAY